MVQSSFLSVVIVASGDFAAVRAEPSRQPERPAARLQMETLGRSPGYDHRSGYQTQMTNTPPREIDGARVIEWAWSGSEPFGEVPGAERPDIYGLAIATYDNRSFYRFSCDQNWATVQDGLYDSIDDAKDQLPDQYRNVVAKWVKI